MRFNTAGPCLADRHYVLPPLARLPEAKERVEAGDYFVVHAPRQTGKTTTLRALAQQLTAEGNFAAVYFSCEAGEAFGSDPQAAEAIVLDRLWAAIARDLPAALRSPAWPEVSPGTRLVAGLSAWCATCPRPVVLVVDEIDALQGDSLRTVLRQLRDGFATRPSHAPHSVILCGLRDVRDYKDAAGSEGRLGTSSPFNIKVASLRLGNFTAEDVANLLVQHTGATGQVFEPDAVEAVFHFTQGQPWLVNALAAEIVEKLAVGGEPITAERVDRAKENLILRRETHLDSLVSKLHEPRVRRVMVPVLDGDSLLDDLTYDDDASYVRDLGLIAPNLPLRVANPIYREVIVRVLSTSAQAMVRDEPRAFVLPDGRLNFPSLLRAFGAFWGEHGGALAPRMAWHEVGHQLVFMAFLQRIVNGGGYIDREYGVGRGRIDLLIRWPWSEGLQREAIELKVWRQGRPDPLTKGLVQLEEYLVRFGLDRGTLVIFDRRDGVPEPEHRVGFEAATTPGGRSVVVMRA